MPAAHVRFSGIPGLEWTAHTYVTWLEMNPLSGSTGSQVNADAGKVALPGRQTTEVVYTTAKGEFTQAVRVEVYYGTLSAHVHLPVIMR